MKKILLFVATWLAFAIQMKAQVVYEQNSCFLLVNGLPYMGTLDSLYTIPGNGLFSPEKTGNFLVLDNCRGKKGRINVYSQDSMTKFWKSIFSTTTKKWQSFGSLNKMEKRSEQEVFFFFKNATIELEKAKPKRKRFWIPNYKNKILKATSSNRGVFYFKHTNLMLIKLKPHYLRMGFGLKISNIFFTLRQSK